MDEELKNLDNCETMQLNREQSIEFIKSLTDPPEPNEALKKLMQRWEKEVEFQTTCSNNSHPQP